MSKLAHRHTTLLHLDRSAQSVGCGPHPAARTFRYRHTNRRRQQPRTIRPYMFGIGH